MWVDDPDFDIDIHVRRIALPKPGTMRQLLDLATLIAADPFDRTRPLWQFVVVEGLRGGKAALVQKMHHTITDGEGGVQMSLQFLDFERDAPEPPPPLDRTPVEPTRAPTAAAAARHDARPARRRASGCRSASPARSASCSPTRRPIPAAGAATVDTVRGVAHAALRRRAGALAAVDASARCGVTSRSCGRRSDDTKDAARRLGGTLNTAFLTAAAEAAGALPRRARRAGRAAAHLDGDQHPHDELGRQRVLARPDARADRRDADRRALRRDPAIAPTRRGDGSRPARRWRRSPRVAAALPTSLVTRLARQQAQTVDFATSNVRGTPIPVYIGGAQLLAELPDRAAGRRGVQPHAAVVHRQPRHGRQHRRRGGRRAGAAAQTACERAFKELAALRLMAPAGWLLADGDGGEIVDDAVVGRPARSAASARRAARRRPRPTTPARD